MNDSAALHSFLRSRSAAMPVQLWIDNCAQPGFSASGPGHVAILASSAYLAILPAGHSGSGLGVAELLAFARDFAGFPRYQRRWRWSAALAVQLDTQLDVQQENVADPSQGSYGYLFLNGAFQKKYLPGGGVPENRAAQADPDACRAATPMLGQVMRVFGTASMLGTTLGATPGHDSFHCYSDHDRVLGMGRGHSERQMMRGAVYEYCERWSASGMPGGVVQGSFDDLCAGADGAVLRPDQLADVPEADSAALYPGFSRTRCLDWIGALRHDAEMAAAPQRCLVPLAMVNYLLPHTTLFSHSLTSNGCAIGNSAAEAALFGALEAIERDALLLTWYSHSTPPRLALGGALGWLADGGGSHALASAELLQLLDSAGYDVACFAIGTEWRVPTVLILLLGRSARQLGAFVTAASHPDPGSALHAALAEAWSLLGSAERNFATHVQRNGASLDYLREQNQALYYADWRQRHHFDFLAHAPDTLALADFLAAPAFPAPPRNPAEAWDLLRARAAQLGYSLIVADNTPPALAQLGLHSARVFIPGAITLTFGEQPLRVPPGRLARAAAACPWIDGRANLATPLLHPLG